MSDDTTTELERLRVDLEVLERYGSEGYGWITNKVRDKIARLEAEQADPWRRAKQVLLEWSRLGSREHPEKWHVINLVTHLTAENDRLAARVAELEKALQNFIDSVVFIDPSVYPQSLQQAREAMAGSKGSHQ